MGAAPPHRLKRPKATIRGGQCLPLPEILTPTRGGQGLDLSLSKTSATDQRTRPRSNEHFRIPNSFLPARAGLPTGIPIMPGGRHRQPIALKVLRGNPRKENLSAIIAAEPKSAAAGSEPPPDLAGAALTKWIESVPMLSTMRVWDEAARETWARYCRIHGLWHECYEIVRRQGQVYEKPSGMLAARPETSLLIQYGAQLVRLECEFGLTPSSRSGAATRGAEIDDPMEAFLREA
jgi:P27 family predicted phage terminase small subunit